MTEARYSAAVKSAASAACALVALLAHLLGWSPEIVNKYFLDLVATLICSAGAAYWAVKHGSE